MKAEWNLATYSYFSNQDYSPEKQLKRRSNGDF